LEPIPLGLFYVYPDLGKVYLCQVGREFSLDFSLGNRSLFRVFWQEPSDDIGDRRENC
jgi:hypothetical protein